MMEEPNGPFNYVKHWALMMMGLTLDFGKVIKTRSKPIMDWTDYLCFKIYFSLKKIKITSF